MSLQRCCSSSMIRTSRLGTAGSKKNRCTTYQKKEIVSFTSSANVVCSTKRRVGGSAVTRNSRAPYRTETPSSTFSTQAAPSSISTTAMTSEVALAGIFSLILSAALMCSFPSSSPSRKTTASCAAIDDGISRYPREGGNRFDPGGSDEDDEESYVAINKCGPYATMALASYGQRQVYGNMHVEQESASRTSVAVHESETKASSRDRPYDVSVRALKGGRITMEDEYFVADGGRFVAVFDGHGGGGVSQYLRRHLYDAVCQHLRHNQNESSNSPAPPPSNDLHSRRSVIPSVISHATALKAAFTQIEESVLVDETLRYQGSTAVAVCLHECQQGHRTLLSANVGDSRAVLSRRGRAVDLTRDHKPNDERERARIMAMGETIEWDRLSQVHRVRNLSLSRAIGDRFAKPVVSGDVEINHFPVMEDADEFIILASDGLWDAMTSEEAVCFVHQTIENELSRANIAKDDTANFKLVLRRNMAKFVAREAIRRGSCDNVCVIMVWLKDLRQ